MVPPKLRYLPQGIRSKKTTLWACTDLKHGISSRIRLPQGEVHEAHSCGTNSETVAGPTGIPCYDDVWGRVQLHPFFNLALDGGTWSTARHNLPPGNEPRYPLNRRLDWPPQPVWRLRWREKYLPLPGIESWNLAHSSLPVTGTSQPKEQNVTLLASSLARAATSPAAVYVRHSTYRRTIWKEIQTRVAGEVRGVRMPTFRRDILHLLVCWIWWQTRFSKRYLPPTRQYGVIIDNITIHSDVVVVWLGLLLCIRKVFGSNLNPGTGCSGATVVSRTGPRAWTCAYPAFCR